MCLYPDLASVTRTNSYLLVTSDACSALPDRTAPDTNRLSITCSTLADTLCCFTVNPSWITYATFYSAITVTPIRGHRVIITLPDLWRSITNWIAGCLTSNCWDNSLARTCLRRSSSQFGNSRANLVRDSWSIHSARLYPRSPLSPINSELRSCWSRRL